MRFFKFLSKKEDYVDCRGKASPTSIDRMIMLLNKAKEEVNTANKLVSFTLEEVYKNSARLVEENRCLREKIIRLEDELRMEYGND